MSSFSSHYRDWLKVADTALPQNIFGYLTQASLAPFRADPFTIVPYDDPKEIAKCGKIGEKSFLPGKLPEREGPRPDMITFMAPNRQVSQLTGDDMHQLLLAAVAEIAAKHSVHVVVRTSVLEKAGEALLIADHIATPHSIAAKTKREIAHVHAGAGSGEYSMHMCLSPVDCKEVITKKWGERMTLAGSFVPHEYLIIYTPRTKEEVEVVKSIVNAAVLFMTGDPEDTK
ncbi:hypothetical protein L207DRAFT_587605 [Hyaloscypha variabilis F]|uniref:Luciferase domain-containing protein n=1 Tax=Hyaloscypha variabilis (strain UAMH 11265 / GT02V1 / F) TaxID=1149755 RepID=A0A2J6R9V6_HYAVF|nr:hypothetical protein L207DRAFT_587605 [Hyaloscypha variabilis F]